MKINLKLKSIRAFLNVLLIVFLSQSVFGQFPIDGAYQSIPTPATPTMPDHGQTTVDNSVPSAIAITRITDVYNYIDDDGNPQVWYPTHGYSKTQIWNADQTKYKISAWKVYDAITYEEEQGLSGMYPSYWSNTDPDIIWGFRENGDIKKHNVSTNTTETVVNVPGYEIIKLGPGEGNIDKNDHYVALVGKKDNGVGSFDLDVIIFDLQTSEIVTTRNFPNAWADGADYAPKYIDWVSVSQSGDFVVIMWNHSTATDDGINQYIENDNLHYGVEVFNTLDMEFQNRIVRYGNHGDLGYAVDGDEVLVQFYGEYGGGTLYMHKLDGSGSTVLTTNSDFGVYGHVSCRNINRPGWAYITHSLATQTGQLVAVKLDDSGIVEHFGHHFSSGTSYEQAAMAVSSPNGDRICFKSDFGTGPNTDPSVAYSFFANLSSTISIDDKLLTDIDVSPIPTNDFIKVVSKDRIKDITIYNEIGQIIKRLKGRNANDININIEELKKGFYYINILTDKKSILKKIIKD